MTAQEAHAVYEAAEAALEAATVERDAAVEAQRVAEVRVRKAEEALQIARDEVERVACGVLMASDRELRPLRDGEIELLWSEGRWSGGKRYHREIITIKREARSYIVTVEHAATTGYGPPLLAGWWEKKSRSYHTYQRHRDAVEAWIARGGR